MRKSNTKTNKREIMLIPNERVISKIFFIRNKKVMIDSDLAGLYGVETKVLNQAVKRNLERFPEDFMFQLTKEEANAWKSEVEIPNLRYQIGTLSSRSQSVTLNNLNSQSVTSSSRYQIGTLKQGENIKYLPYVFTEQGVAMLSSVLNSKRAIQVNIQIIRTFTQFRELLLGDKELRTKIEKMEKKYDSKLKEVFDLLKQLIMEEVEPKGKIGYRR